MNILPGASIYSIQIQINSICTALLNLEQNLGSGIDWNLCHHPVVHLLFKRTHVGLISTEHRPTFRINEEKHIDCHGERGQSTD
jgi:hypothetical protein